MASSHFAAGVLVHQEKLFNNLSSFHELEQRIQSLHDQNTKAVGDAFEIFVEAYLATQVAFQAKKVWIVRRVPPQVRQQLNLPADAKGIDGVFQTHSGELVPYQVKFRTERGTLNFTEVAPFLAITERAKDRILFTNAKALATDAANRDALRVVRRADFHQLTEHDFRAIEAWLKELPPPKLELLPWPHQREAIEQITAALNIDKRTTAVMACGSGKTLVALWVAEAIKPKAVLVLVPSLSLLSQTLREWCRANPWGARFNFLCVCSDPTVSKGTDDIILHKTERPFRIDTDPQVVRDFLMSDLGGVRVVFSTYQSVGVVADAARGLPPFDMGIFDEAHKTTGPHGGTFAYALNDNNLTIGNRLFLTATPRHYDINRRDREGDFRIVSMDDEAIYGRVSYKLPFAEAARRDIICSYKILISVITADELNTYLLDHGITLVDGDQIGAHWVANQIALTRAIEKTDVSKIITFHSRVHTAKAFADVTPYGIARHIDGFSVFHVNGEQPAAVRDDSLDAFRDADRALIANARCLTEGIDVPAVDMVAFIDPRKSRVDIAQAAGRAMRKAPNTNKTVGYVLVPLFLEQAKGQSIEEALDHSDFGEVANVVNAMGEQDDLLIDTIRELRESPGRGEVFNPRRLRDSVEVIGPPVGLDAIARAIDVKLIERLGSSWDEMFGRLVAYKQQHGDCLVPITYSDKQLGRWISKQRSLKYRGKLELVRIQRLEGLGCVWNPRDESWDEMLGRLIAYKQEHGNCLVPINYRDKQLAQWVMHQRSFKNRNKLEPIRIQRLEELGFVWEPHDDSWDEMFGRLAGYKQQHGDCLVPINYSDKQLASWVNAQRNGKNRGKLEAPRVQRLENLGFVWGARDDSREDMFGRLAEYKRRHGDCLVPVGYSDKQLANWIHNQRRVKNRGKLDAARIQRLEMLGFVWDAIGESWEHMFGRLAGYKQQHGDCLIPQRYSDKQLAHWVNVQRTVKNRGKLEPARVQRLEELGFVWKVRGERSSRPAELHAVTSKGA